MIIVNWGTKSADGIIHEVSCCARNNATVTGIRTTNSGIINCVTRSAAGIIHEVSIVAARNLACIDNVCCMVNVFCIFI